VISLILYLILDRDFRKIILTNKNKTVLFLLCFFITILPNLIWNILNGWVTLTHTSSNAGLDRIDLNFFQGGEFLLIQLLMIGPLFSFFVIFFLKKIKFNKTHIFLLIFSMPAIIIVLLESILVRANANWAAVGLVALYILFFNIIYSQKIKLILLSNVFNFLLGMCLFFLISISSNISLFDRINGITDFSNKLRANYLVSSKVIVVSDRLLFSNLKYIYKDKDIKLYMPYNPTSEITNHFELSSPLNANISQDFILLGFPESINYLKNKYEIKKLKKINNKFKKGSINIYEVTF
jgi:hypothetical protein